MSASEAPAGDPSDESRHLSGPLALLVATGLGGVAFSWFVAQHSLLGARWHLIGFMAGWTAVWVLGGWAAGRVGSRRLAVISIVVIGAALRFAAATGTTPSISADLYRYGWDAHVQLSGVDPYRYPPDSRALAAVRTTTWFPTPAGCRHIGKQPGCTTIDRANVRTIYPPVAEAWFDLVDLAWPGQEGARPWQIAGGLVDDAVILMLLVASTRSGKDPRQVAWYALSPVPVIEFAGNGHVDVVALLLLVAAVLALRRDRRWLAGLLIGMATMVKLYPAAALVAGWRKGRWRMVLAFTAVVVASELPHVIAVGWKVVGYLPGYIQEEHYSTGGRFLLVGMLGLPGPVTTALTIVLLTAVMGWVLLAARRGRQAEDPAVGLAILLTALILLASPVQPWYAVTVGGLGMLVGAPWLLLPALFAEPYYAAVILADPHQVAAGRTAYGAALAGIVIGLWWHRHRRDGSDRATFPSTGRQRDELDLVVSRRRDGE